METWSPAIHKRMDIAYSMMYLFNTMVVWTSTKHDIHLCNSHRTIHHNNPHHNTHLCQNNVLYGTNKYVRSYTKNS